MCKDKKNGGLGFNNIEWFNLALVMKWVWRFLDDKGALWARVIRSVHGEVNWGEQGSGGVCLVRPGGGWWNKILQIASGEGGEWFNSNVRRKVGDGNGTKFWLHIWTGTEALWKAFPRLFRLSSNKEATILDMGRWINGIWMWDLKWRRELFDREREAANSLLARCAGFSPYAGSIDRWEWIGHKNGVYTTNSAYVIIKALREERLTVNSGTKAAGKIWKAPAPQKARMTAWRALRNRLPTCDNLTKRNVELCEVERSCNACLHQMETTNHLFLQCPKSEAVWNNIQKWIGFLSIRPQGLAEHFISFSHLGKGKKSNRFLMALWSCTIWVLWRRRNESRFEGKAWEINHTTMEIKSRMWSWNSMFELLAWESSFRSWSALDISNILCN